MVLLLFRSKKFAAVKFTVDGKFDVVSTNWLRLADDCIMVSYPRDYGDLSRVMKWVQQHRMPSAKEFVEYEGEVVYATSKCHCLP